MSQEFRRKPQHFLSQSGIFTRRFYDLPFGFYLEANSKTVVDMQITQCFLGRCRRTQREGRGGEKWLREGTEKFSALRWAEGLCCRQLCGKTCFSRSVGTYLGKTRIHPIKIKNAQTYATWSGPSTWAQESRDHCKSGKTLQTNLYHHNGLAECGVFLKWNAICCTFKKC